MQSIWREKTLEKGKTSWSEWWTMTQWSTSFEQLEACNKELPIWTCAPSPILSNHDRSANTNRMVTSYKGIIEFWQQNIPDVQHIIPHERQWIHRLLLTPRTDFSKWQQNRRQDAANKSDKTDTMRQIQRITRKVDTRHTHTTTSQKKSWNRIEMANLFGFHMDQKMK